MDREYGIDILRSLATFGVVCLHTFVLNNININYTNGGGWR